MLLACGASYGQAISLDNFTDGINHWNNEHLDKKYPCERYAPEQYKGIADNLVAWQNADGGWPKNIDILGKYDVASMRENLSAEKKSRMYSTLDNRNTYPQIVYLARAYAQSGDKRYVESASRGLQYVIELQNASGGWRGWDVDAITFNDEVSTGAMETLRLVVDNNPDFAWVDKTTREKAQAALDRAVDMILRAQIVIDGKKTAWCQQHDHVTLAPKKARSYELPSLCPVESGYIITYLMTIPNPSPEIKDAIRTAAKWIDEHKIEGIKVVFDKESPLINERTGKQGDMVVVSDPGSKTPYWARYYDLKTQQPFFCRRDGVVVATLAEVNHERRTGYSWYNTGLKKVLSDYAKWEKAQK